jgi:hypothetical protein
MYHVIVRKTVRPSPTRPVQKCRRLNAEELFGRIVEKSDAIRRACGFDSELYDAIQGLSR